MKKIYFLRICIYFFGYLSLPFLLLPLSSSLPRLPFHLPLLSLPPPPFLIPFPSLEMKITFKLSQLKHQTKSRYLWECVWPVSVPALFLSYLFICLTCLSVCLSIYIYIYLSLFLSLSHLRSLSFSLSLSLFLYLSLSLSIYLSISPSL